MQNSKIEELDPKVSVIITTYNRSKILVRRSLPSVLNQTYTNFECIIIDDCSQDDTEKEIGKIIEKYKNLRYIRQEKNKGISASKKRGILEAKGEYIVFLDDDDEFFEDFLKVLVPKLDKLPKTFGAVTCARIVSHKMIEEYIMPSLGESFYTSISSGWLIRKEVYENIFYNEKLRSHEDSDFGIQFFQIYKAYVLDAPLKRVYSIYDKPHLSTPTKETNNSLNIFLNKNLPIFIEKANRRELSFIYRFAGRNFFLAGERKKGRIYFKKAFRTVPSLRNFLHLFLSYFSRKFYSFVLYIERQIGAIKRSKYNPKCKRYFVNIPKREKHNII